MTNKEAVEQLKNYHYENGTVPQEIILAIKALEEDKWFDCIEAGTLKARHGDYVLYKVDFLLNNLTREVYIMEGTRRMRGKEE